MAASERVAGKEHLPRYTRSFIALPIIQLICAVIALGLTAFSVTVISITGNCLMLFTSLVTIIVTIWLILALSCAPQAYNYWAALALAIFLVVIWLISFALLAVETVALFSLGSTYCYSTVYDYRCYTDSLEGEDVTYVFVLAAATGVGGVSFVLWLVNLVITSCAVCRHRQLGFHSSPLEKGIVNRATPSNDPTHASIPNQNFVYCPQQQRQQQQQQQQQQQPPLYIPPQEGYWAPPPPDQPHPGQYYHIPLHSTIGRPVSPLPHSSVTRYSHTSQ